VKRTHIIRTLGPYSEILKETEGKSQQSPMHTFFKKGKLLNQELYLKSKISALCHIQRSVLGHYNGTYRNFQPGL
jgi:hypothetical protein